MKKISNEKAKNLKGGWTARCRASWCGYKKVSDSKNVVVICAYAHTKVMGDSHLCTFNF